MLNFLSITFAVFAVIVFLMIVYTITPLLKGGFSVLLISILLPGLGIVVPLWLLLAFLVLVELMLVTIAVLLARWY